MAAGVSCILEDILGQSDTDFDDELLDYEDDDVCYSDRDGRGEANEDKGRSDVENFPQDVMVRDSPAAAVSTVPSFPGERELEDGELEEGELVGTPTGAVHDVAGEDSPATARKDGGPGTVQVLLGHGPRAASPDSHAAGWRVQQTSNGGGLQAGIRLVPVEWRCGQGSGGGRQYVDLDMPEEGGAATGGSSGWEREMRPDVGRRVHHELGGQREARLEWVRRAPKARGWERRARPQGRGAGRRGTPPYRKEEGRQNMSSFVHGVAASLKERKVHMVEKAVEVVGRRKVEELVKEVYEVERKGGQMVADGTRRREPGGVFWALLRERIPLAEWAQIRVAGQRRPSGKKGNQQENQRRRRSISTDLNEPLSSTVDGVAMDVENIQAA